MLLLFALTLPWTTIGFWNAVIGFALMSFARDPAGVVAPYLRNARRRRKGSRAPPRSSSAFATKIPRACRAISTWMLEGLAATREAALVPSLHPERQQPACDRRSGGEGGAALADRFGTALGVTYRRREQSIGYKAGNIRDFCERWGSCHRIRHRARRRQRHDAAGDAAPRSHHAGASRESASCKRWSPACRAPALSRASSSSACGSACAPIRWARRAGRAIADRTGAITPYSPGAFHRALRAARAAGQPPLGGHVLCHDQLEAVLMRRAGYEVRVLPDEEGSWEENPPTLLEFIRRDLRWCQGNMQYFHFLTLPRLLPVSRCQIAPRHRHVSRLAGLAGLHGARVDPRSAFPISISASSCSSSCSP